MQVHLSIHLYDIASNSNQIKDNRCPAAPTPGLSRDHLGTGANSLWKGRPANLQGWKISSCSSCGLFFWTSNPSSTSGICD